VEQRQSMIGSKNNNPFVCYIFYSIYYWIVPYFHTSFNISYFHEYLLYYIFESQKGC